MSENEERKYSIEKFSQLTHNLAEANNYGQFSSDFNQPLAQSLRDDIRSMIEYLPGIEHILKTNPFDKEQQSTVILTLTDEDFFEEFIEAKKAEGLIPLSERTENETKYTVLSKGLPNRN